MKFWPVLGVSLVLSLLLFAPHREMLSQQNGVAAGTKAGSATTQRIFFSFEHDLWDEVVGADLKLEPMTKYSGNPVLPRGPLGAPDSGRVSYTSLFPEGGRLRAWYGAMEEKAQKYAGIGYAESEDGIHWTKPNLDLAKPGTNLVIGAEGQAALLTVVPDDTGNGKSYRGLIHFLRPANGGHEQATFQVMTSPDGLHWNFTKTPATDIPATEELGLYRRNGEWWVLGQGISPYFSLPDGEPHGRVTYGFHSRDGVKWELFPLPLFWYPFNPDFPDSSLQQHMGPAIWDRGRIVLGIAGQLHPASFSQYVGMTLGLMYSYDGMKWTEPFPATAILKLGPKGSWDSGWHLQVQQPVSRGKSTYFFYSGSDGGNLIDTHFALGLALLRRDGFAAYTANRDKATLVTAPLECIPGEVTLYLNLAGRMTVQILDQYMDPVSSPKLVEADDVRIPALDLRELKLPPKFRLAFRMSEGAKLYTFSFGPTESELSSLSGWE